MSLSDLVLSIADNKQMLGLRYAEWATRAPSLEADIAAAAMGLDDLGHSRVLYGCLEPLGEDPRGPQRETDPGSLRSLSYFDEPWTEWSQFVAANSVLDTAFTVMIEACVGGSVEVLRHRLRKMLMEERYHFLHGRSWLRSGIDTEPLHRAWREAVEWFGKVVELQPNNLDTRTDFGTALWNAGRERYGDGFPEPNAITAARWVRIARFRDAEALRNEHPVDPRGSVRSSATNSTRAPSRSLTTVT